MKYLKYFEDYEFDQEFDQDGEETLSNMFSEDPIISEIVKHVTEISNPSMFGYEICEAIYWYIQGYNEDIPYIHYLRNLLSNALYKHSSLSKFENMEEDAARIYKVMTELDINKAILESPNAMVILSYLRNNDPAFFNYLQWYRGEHEIEIAADMGDLGFK